MESHIVRGRIIEAAIKLEGNFDLIISRYFCRFDESYNDFIPVILHSREFTFNLKKQVFLFILHKHYDEDMMIKRFLSEHLTKGKKIDSLISDLINIRNKISHHFSVIGESDGEDIIAFYVGTHKRGKTDVNYSEPMSIKDIEKYEQTVNAIVAMIAIMEQDLEIELSKKG